MLHYKLIGSEGPLLVCIHGFLESLQMWQKINWQKIGIQVLMVDLPGHGKSTFTADENNPDLNFPTDEILNLLNGFNVKEYNIIGHSLGGYIALAIKKKDKRCKKTILLNSNYWTDSPAKKRDRIRVADIVFKSKSLFLKHAIPALFVNPEKNKKETEELINQASRYLPESIAYYSLAMRKRVDFSNDINEDCFAIQGEMDLSLSKIQLRGLQSIFENRLFLIKGSGHMSIYEKTSCVQNVIKKILFN